MSDVFNNLILLFETFRLFNISVYIYAVYIICADQKYIIKKFNILCTTIIMLIALYQIKSVNLNLQHQCWNIILFNFFSSQSFDLQTVSCVHCFENSMIIINVEKYFLDKTFNNYFININIKKFLFDVMTELNMILFQKEENDVIDVNIKK